MAAIRYKWDDVCQQQYPYLDSLDIFGSKRGGEGRASTASFRCVKVYRESPHKIFPLALVIINNCAERKNSRGS